MNKGKISELIDLLIDEVEVRTFLYDLLEEDYKKVSLKMEKFDLIATIVFDELGIELTGKI